VYVPLEYSIVEESEKPQEYKRLFEIKAVESDYQYGGMKISYDIREIPEKKEFQTRKFNAKAFERMNRILRSIRRVFFSLKREADEPKFFVIVVADTRIGIELIDTTYVDDLKKASYEIISWTEYRHRTVEDIKFSPEAVGDLEGRHLQPYNVDFADFIIKQIKQRINYKFGQPEVKKGADIDKEILKTVKNVLEIYNFKDFLLVDLDNLATSNKTSLSRAAVLEKLKD